MLQLTPDKLKHPPLPEKNSEITKEATEVLDVNGPLNIPANAVTVMRIKTGHFTVNVSINTLVKADRLMVTFQGARGGGKGAADVRRPMFGRRNFEALFQCPILSISDPQTELEWGSHLPRVGMYIGTFEQDLVPELNHMIDRFAEELGIPVARVNMYGSSSGGTSAMLVGAARRTPTGIIAVVPFLRPDKFREEVVAITARAANGTMETFHKMLETTPERFNPIAALRAGLAAGTDLRVVVAQNLKDKVTIKRHFPALWRRFELDPEGGVSTDGHVMALLFDSIEAGHGHEPPELSFPLVKIAYDFFDKPLQVASAEEIAKRKSRRVSGEVEDDIEVEAE
jgi:hypothetical protein